VASRGFSATARLSCIDLRQRSFECEITAIMRNHGDSRKSQHTTGKSHDDHIIDDTDNIDPSLLRNRPSQSHGHKFTARTKHRTQSALCMDVYGIVFYLTSSFRENHANIRIYLIFLETTIIGLHFAADCIGLSSLKFLCWAP